MQSKTQNIVLQEFTQSKTQNPTPQGLNEFFICGENPHKIHKIYTKATKNALKPAKIDYIIFLDSDDFWDKNCLAECLKAAYGGENLANSSNLKSANLENVNSANLKNAPQGTQSVDMVWMDFQPFFDGIAPFEHPSYQEAYEFTPKNSQKTPQKENATQNALNSQKQNAQNSLKITTPQNFLTRASKTKHPLLAAAVQFLVRFEFLKKHNLRFIKGIVWEDVLWCETAIVRASRTAVLGKRLYNFRIRAGSTSGYDGARKSLPPFVAPLARHFSDTNEAWGYFSAYSWAVSLAEFDTLCNELSSTHGEGFASEFCQLFAPYIIKNTLALFEFKRDPYGVKGETAGLRGRLP